MATSDTLHETKLRRVNQTCKVYTLKIDFSKVSRKNRKHLSTLFYEAKWLYNSILASENIKNYDTKIQQVDIKVKDEFQPRSLKFISSQMKQAVRDRTFQNILNLSKAKKKGIRVGKLKFKSFVNCIPLKQNRVTYAIDRKNKAVKIQGIRRKLKVLGIEQIPQNAEFANANLIQSPSGFFIKVTTYVPKVEKVIPNKIVGIDMGCQTQLTLSNGAKLEFEVPIPKQLKRLDRKIMKKKRKRSNNKLKDQAKRRKVYEKLNNKKADIRNKIVSTIAKNYKYVCVQDENIKGWQASGHGKKIQNTGIGGILRDLKNKSHTSILVDKFFPSTQHCPICGCKTKHEQWQRTFVCSVCGYTEDRDYKSAICIEEDGRRQLKEKLIPEEYSRILLAECKDVKPAETEASVLAMFSTLENLVDVSFCRKTQQNLSSHILLRKRQEAQWTSNLSSHEESKEAHEFIRG